MSRKCHSVDQIIGKLRQDDAELGQGKTLEEACRGLEIAVQTPLFSQSIVNGGPQVRRGAWATVYTESSSLPVKQPTRTLAGTESRTGVASRGVGGTSAGR